MINILTRTRQDNYYLNDFNDSHTLKSFYNVASIYCRVLIFQNYTFKTFCYDEGNIWSHNIFKQGFYK